MGRFTLDFRQIPPFYCPSDGPFGNLMKKDTEPWRIWRIKNLFTVSWVAEMNRNLRYFFRNQYEMAYRIFSLYYFKIILHVSALWLIALSYHTIFNWPIIIKNNIFFIWFSMALLFQTVQLIKLLVATKTHLNIYVPWAASHLQWIGTLPHNLPWKSHAGWKLL